MNNIIIRLASIEETIQCYNTLILDSFPANEVKPLESILRMQNDGLYFVVALLYEGKIAATAFTTGYPNGKSYLLDYLVVDKKLRNKGLGMTLIKEVALNYVNHMPLLIETETLRSAETEAEVLQRKKRNAFYKNAGAVQSDLITNIFGAEYNIWQMNEGDVDLMEEFENIYHYMVPGHLYDKEVHIPAEV